MGFLGDAANKIRNYFQFDKEQVGLQLAKSATASGFPDSGQDILQAYGYDVLSDYLKLEHDLLARFIDYEEMDDYAEIACLSRCTRVGVLGKGEHGLQYRTIGDLIEHRLHYPTDRLYTLAVDIAGKRVVPVEFSGPILSGKQQPVFKVTFVEHHAKVGHPRRQWSIRATANHPFMLRDGTYRTVADLKPKDCLMPCPVATSVAGYPQLRDLFNSGNGGTPIWHQLHKVVVEGLQRPIARDEIVHHVDEDKQNTHPLNLRIETRSDHSKLHQVSQRPEVKEKLRERAKSRWADPVQATEWAKSQRKSGDPNDRSHLKSANPTPKGILSDEHRAAIAAGHTIPLARDVVEAALRTSPSVSAACRKLKVSWNTLSRRMAQYGFSADMLGTSLQSIHPDDPAYENHVVVSVEPDGFDDVYDIEVPVYKNFIAEGVFVHNTAIDIFADDSSQPETHLNRTIWVTSEDHTVQQMLDDLFHRTLRMDEEIWEIGRNLVKYGNDYEEILVTDEGVKGLNFMASPTVRRIEGPRGELYGFVQDFRGRFGYTPAEFQQIMANRSAMRQGGSASTGLSGMDRISALEDWEVVHFRLRGKHRRSIYGHSVLEPARWIWKRLMLLEDSALIYRLQRAPERYAFYVDIGDLPPQEALAYMNRIRQQHRKKKYVNPANGKFDFKFDPLSSDEDFFVPVRNGAEGTRIEVLGAPNWQSMEDITYFRDKLFAAIKVPKAYLGQQDGVARAVLSSEDVRFARTVLRIQREMRNGLGKVARVHLAALGIDPRAVPYDIHMTVPSSIFELAQLEVRNARADLASRMNEFVSLHWVMKEVFGLADEEVEVIFKQRQQEAEIEGERQGTTQAIITKKTAAAQFEAQAEAPPPPAPPQEGVPMDGDQTGGQAQPKRGPSPFVPNNPPPVSMPESYSPIRGPLIISKPSTPSKGRYDLERRLFEGGNRESQKRASEKLDKLSKSSDLTNARLKEVTHFLQELKYASVAGNRR